MQVEMAEQTKTAQTYRDVVQLREIEELTTGKTAKVLGLTGGTVKTRAFRAQHALRRKLTERLGISARQAARSFFLESRSTRGRLAFSRAPFRSRAFGVED
jgi:hypothetical protein